MQSEPHERLVTAINAFLGTSPGVPAACVAVHRPDDTTSVALGWADPDTEEAMTPDHAVRIASCTKTFVASAVLDLAASGAVDLDGPVLGVAPPAVASMLDAYEHGGEITVRQLLQHRSGMIDHTETGAFVETLESSGGTHEWTALAQLTLALGHPPVFSPGKAFSYSDSGYVLLGLVVEHLTGGSLAAAVRTTCRLDELGLRSLHWERTEPTPPGLRRAHQYLDGIDTTGWNPTIDLYGGGGLVSTMPDLARWWSALFAGDVHGHLRAQVADPRPSIGPDGSDSGLGVGVGIFRHEVDGIEIWEHSGYWGLSAFHIPERATSVAMVVTARADGIELDDLRSQVVELLTT